MTLPRIALRRFTADQGTLFEITQHAAQITGIEVQRAADLGRGARAAVADLVENPRFAERVGAVEKILAQHADLPRVKAVEAADGGDAAFMLASGHAEASPRYLT